MMQVTRTVVPWKSIIISTMIWGSIVAWWHRSEIERVRSESNNAVGASLTTIRIRSLPVEKITERWATKEGEFLIQLNQDTIGEISLEYQLNGNNIRLIYDRNNMFWRVADPGKGWFHQ